MIINKNKIKEIQVLTNDNEVIASITDDNIIKKLGYTVVYVPVQGECDNCEKVKRQQQLDIQDEIDKTIKFVCDSVRDESVYSEQRAELIKALAELVSARTLMKPITSNQKQCISKRAFIEATESTKSILKETGLKLKEVQILPDTLLYVSLYHLALAVDNIGKHELSKDICHALLNELEKQELISKRAFIEATEDIKSQYHV